MTHQVRESLPKSGRRPRRRFGWIALWGAASIAGFAAASLPSEPENGSQSGNALPAAAEDLVAVARPPFSPDVFPCSECHAQDDEVDRTRRVVDFHDTVHFEHDAEHRWCLDCHDAQNRDMLKLADGRLLPFTESYMLCAQCHGTKYRDWRAGEHGRRTGSWSGTKEYLLCVHCHDPHSPKFKEMTPLPPPIRQEALR